MDLWQHGKWRMIESSSSLWKMKSFALVDVENEECCDEDEDGDGFK
jgi:hypothetical protein